MPGGTISSNSSSNEIEMLYDSCLKTSSRAGTYTIKIRKKDNTPFSLCGSALFEPIAVAWDIVPAP